MTDAKRFAVPLDELDRVHVELLEQVTEQDTVPRRFGWDGGPLVPAFGGGGGGGDADGD